MDSKKNSKLDRNFQRPEGIWLSYLKKYWLTYLVGLFFVLVTDIMQVISARTVGWIIDFFTEGKTPEILKNFSLMPESFFKEKQSTFYLLFFIMLFSRIFLTLGRIGWRLTLARKTHHAGAYLKRRVWDQARFFKKEDLHQKFTKGVLMNNSNSDVNSARMLFGFSLVGASDVIFLGLFTVIAMWSIDPELCVLSLLVLTFLPIVIQKLSYIEVERYRKAQDALSDLDNFSSQSVATIRLQRIIQSGKIWSQKLWEMASIQRIKKFAALKTSLLYIPLMGGASVISYLVLFAIGIQKTVSGQLSIGDFMAMQGLIFLLQDPFIELGIIISEWRRGMTSLGRLNEIYLNPGEEFFNKDSDGEEKKGMAFSLRNLSFQFPDGKNPIFSNISLDLKVGQKLGVKGPIGAGKTTFLNILGGLERKHEGELELFGNSLNEYTHEQIRDWIGIVPQKSFLFASSIKNNLQLNQNLTDEEVWHFLELAGLADDVRKFPNKIYTELGEWGINLSGGQKQRLTLARALARRPRILLLDDCLSAVDSITEEKIIKNLEKELRQSTVIWVAHRESTLKNCDSVITLNDY